MSSLWNISTAVPQVFSVARPDIHGIMFMLILIIIGNVCVYDYVNFLPIHKRNVNVIIVVISVFGNHCV